jgi:hypothetical protein
VGNLKSSAPARTSLARERVADRLVPPRRSRPPRGEVPQAGGMGPKSPGGSLAGTKAGFLDGLERTEQCASPTALFLQRVSRPGARDCAAFGRRGNPVKLLRNGGEIPLNGRVGGSGSRRLADRKAQT